MMSQQTTIHGAGNGQENRVSSRALIKDQGRLIIIHNGEEYTLRITRNGKLILNK